MLKVVIVLILFPGSFNVSFGRYVVSCINYFPFLVSMITNNNEHSLIIIIINNCIIFLFNQVYCFRSHCIIRNLDVGRVTLLRSHICKCWSWYRNLGSQVLGLVIPKLLTLQTQGCTCIWGDKCRRMSQLSGDPSAFYVTWILGHWIHYA